MLEGIIRPVVSVSALSWYTKYIHYSKLQFLKGAVVVVIVWYLDLQIPVQSVSITTKIVSSNPAHGEMYSIQHYVIKFVGDLRQVDGFLRIL